jgi:hypothetical protein
MQTTGAALVAVRRCSSVRVRMLVQGSCSAYGLLYLAAVRGGVCPPKCPSSVSWRRCLSVPTDEHPTYDKPGHRERYPEGNSNLAPFTLSHDHKIRLDCGIGLRALGGDHLIRRLCHAYPLPAHSTADLPKRYSLVRSRRQR